MGGHVLCGVNSICSDQLTQNTWVIKSRGRAYHWREGGQGWVTRGDHYAEGKKVGTDINGDTGVLGLCAYHRMCVFEVHIVDTT